uniref:Large ribosomal subunit protein uL15/eL18 domain-containing protein n=1 Tax=Strombidium inclinatum TaxID=197538 RepID=A0A7S3IY71_9SPIT|mmetsp:Transcript_42657/g.65431  ORF Transcript_42657/g.65431 Transcript_42657/m.65431 type:complete len:178 (+) Transcript_42657:52-585(+)
MGIDLVKRGRIKNSNKKNTRSTNLYIHLLIKLFRFLARRTESGFSKTVLRRLIASRVNRPPLSLSKIVKHLKGQDKIVVTVATVTDDNRLLEIPKMTVAALRFTEAARARIIKAGGKCLTLDQVVMTAPTGTGTLLLRANQDREAKKHFGPAPGVKGSHTKPYVRSKGKNFEKGVSV